MKLVKSLHDIRQVRPVGKSQFYIFSDSQSGGWKKVTVLQQARIHEAISLNCTKIRRRIDLEISIHQGSTGFQSPWKYLLLLLLYFQG